MAGRGAQSAPRARGRGASQHFLRSGTLAEALVRDAAVTGDDVVLDVGAGAGRLTAPLADRAALVYAVEVDPTLARGLHRRFGSRANVVVVVRDALQAPLPTEEFRVVANLPFGGATAILRRLLACPQLLRADVVVEWEVARKRALPWPSTMLGVCWGVHFHFALVRRLPAACFAPRPRVDAGLLRIVRRDRPLVPDSGLAAFETLVGIAFRRDMPVRRAVHGLVTPEAFKRAALELGFDRSARPRDLDAHQWAGLFHAVRRSS